tara:strand:+ start:34667 stop:34891 length:225 start_codon:yes stop_codon:yes gene_type:complete
MSKRSTHECLRQYCLTLGAASPIIIGAEATGDKSSQPGDNTSSVTDRTEGATGDNNPEICLSPHQLVIITSLSD